LWSALKRSVSIQPRGLGFDDSSGDLISVGVDADDLIDKSSEHVVVPPMALVVVGAGLGRNCDDRTVIGHTATRWASF